MLELSKVRLTQGDFSLAADFTVSVGITAVMGPSGAGKSTLFDIIAGFIQPQSGTVRWDGQNLTKIAPGDRPVSILFQDNNLFPHLSVAENALLALRAAPGSGATKTVAARAALARVGLAGFEDRKPGQLSGGQQSRAALARVLLQDRPVVLLDEPFAALGPALKDEMLALVAEILTGRTVLMATHDPSDAQAISTNIIVVADGVASPPDATQRVLTNPPAALAAYLGGKPH